MMSRSWSGRCAHRARWPNSDDSASNARDSSQGDGGIAIVWGLEAAGVSMVVTEALLPELATTVNVEVGEMQCPE